MNSNEIKAGAKVVMTHSQRQAFLKNSALGKLLGVSHLLPEVEQETNKEYARFIKALVFVYSVKPMNPNSKFFIKALSQ